MVTRHRVYRPPADHIDQVVVERLVQGRPAGRSATFSEKKAAFVRLLREGASANTSAKILKMNWKTATEIAREYHKCH